jgi:hypothetical protein
LQDHINELEEEVQQLNQQLDKYKEGGDGMHGEPFYYYQKMHLVMT